MFVTTSVCDPSDISETPARLFQGFFRDLPLCVCQRLPEMPR